MDLVLFCSHCQCPPTALIPVLEMSAKEITQQEQKTACSKMLAAVKNGKQLSTEEIRNVRKLVEKMIANLYMVSYTTTRNGNNNAFAEWWNIFLIWQQMEKVEYKQVYIFWQPVRYALILRLFAQ